MALSKLTIDNLGDFDSGAARAVINHAIGQAVADLDDRGAEDKKPRKVVITLTLERQDNGEVRGRVEVSVKAPGFRTAGTTAKVAVDQATGKPGLLFNQYAPDNPSQRTIDEELA